MRGVASLVGNLVMPVLVGSPAELTHIIYRCLCTGVHAQGHLNLKGLF